MNCHFRPKQKNTRHPPPWMFAYVDELYPKPDTLQHSFYYDSRVDVCVRLFLKCHFEPVWPVRNGLRQGFSFGSQTA